jgi:diadenylate cyclase
MFSYNTIQTIVQLFRMIFDILILWILLYYGVKIVRNNARTSQIFKGIVFILVVRAAADFFGFTAVSWLATLLVTWGPLAIIIIFQPEIRSLLERLGKTTVFSRLSTLSGNERQRLVDALVAATADLSTERIGALITIEQGHSLNNYIATGTQMNSLVSADLIESIFVPTTPLHDGAIIIQGDRIACASAYFPPTTIDLPSKIGARHRAAIGISEITDSITIVVSEKSGRISIAEKGDLIPITHAELRNYLEKAIIQDMPEVDHTKTMKTKSTMTILPITEEKKSRFMKRVKRTQTQDKPKDPEGDKEPEAVELPQLDLEYSVSDKSLLDDEPSDKDQEVK